jgi:hypothetical protein
MFTDDFDAPVQLVTSGRVTHLTVRTAMIHQFGATNTRPSYGRKQRKSSQTILVRDVFKRNAINYFR